MCSRPPVTSARKIAGGDLTQRVTVASHDELGSLSEAFNQMAVNLQKTMAKVTGSQGKLGSVVETVGSRSRLVLDSVDRQGSTLDQAYSALLTDLHNRGLLESTLVPWAGKTHPYL